MNYGICTLNVHEWYIHRTCNSILGLNGVRTRDAHNPQLRIKSRFHKQALQQTVAIELHKE